jgi:hypothetical protein
MTTAPIGTNTLIAIFTTKAQKTVTLPIDTLSIEVAGMRTCSWNVWNSTVTQLIVGWAHQISIEAIKLDRPTTNWAGLPYSINSNLKGLITATVLITAMTLH